MTDESVIDREEITKTFENFVDDAEETLSALELKKQEVSTSYSILESLKKRLSNSSFNDKIQLDVGGKIFATSRYTLTNGRSEFFTKLFTGDGNKLKTEEGTYFIDRNPSTFGFILDYLRGNELDTFELSTKEFKQLQSDVSFFGIKELFDSINDSVTFLWSNGANSSITNSGKTATASGHACFVFVNEAIQTTKKRIIALEVDTKSNSWAHVALGKNKSFRSLGNGYGSQEDTVPFMYHVNNGQVNGVGGFPTGTKSTVRLYIENKKVRFSVNDKMQNGEWALPDVVYLLCDIYHTSSTVTLLSK